MKIKDILSNIAHVEFMGDAESEVHSIVRIYESIDDPKVITWCSDKNLQLLEKRKAGTVICSPKGKESTLSPEVQLLITEHPRSAFRQLLLLYQKAEEEALQAKVSASAQIHPSAKLGKDVFIGEHVVIEAGCEIGDFTYIGHNTVIMRRTRIGNHVKVGNNNTIGGVGFGYEKDENGTYELIPHLGNVEIEDQVEIGNNTCIDRAVIGSTLIKTHAKIDNLVHISHGVTVGENSLVIAHAMVAGSVNIGKNVWVAPTSSILNGTYIEDDAVIGMGAVVIRPVLEGQVVVGNPAKPLQKK